jgi:hypothetical protein
MGKRLRDQALAGRAKYLEGLFKKFADGRCPHRLQQARFPVSMSLHSKEYGVSNPNRSRTLCRVAPNTSTAESVGFHIRCWRIVPNKYVSFRLVSRGEGPLRLRNEFSPSLNQPHEQN